MILLYVALQVIRLVMVVLLLPALTKGGYGMNYRQLAVLAFAGLRGAYRTVPCAACFQVLCR